MTRKFRYDPATDSVVEVGSSLPPRKASAWAKPMHCEALAVEPEHIEFARQDDASKGLGDTEYDRKGCPVFYSQSSYDRYKKSHGYYDKNAGYSGVPPTYK